MRHRHELLAFSLVLASMIAVLHHKTLFQGRILSPADVLFVSASFRDERGPLYEPANRLLTDPVLQVEPWLEHNRKLLRQGRLPLWNDFAGCGVPHLANGQSAVFDPVNLIAYVGSMPDALAWMAATRLWVAGFGMFLLARSWRLGRAGRWFAGLAYPFCGFVTVWLLFSVTAVAIWLPWLMYMTERCLRCPSAKSMAGVAVVVGFSLLAGHVQTSAHCLLASGLYALWRGRGWGTRFAWGSAVLIGILLAAIEVVPLWVYLGKSPVWADRAGERASPLTLKAPRILDSVCTAFPYVFGSQRRGQPNLARALGVHNLNESAGGFAGLITLVWLAPLAVWTRKRSRRVQFLALLTVIGAMGAFEVPPIPNLIRLLPVLNVTDNRRLTLWVAFGLVMLGGIGLDRLTARARPQLSSWVVRLGIVAAVLLILATLGLFGLKEQLRTRSLIHYNKMSKATEGADPEVYRQRAERQVRQTISFMPFYLMASSIHCLTIAGLAWRWSRSQHLVRWIQPAVFMLGLGDLIVFGYQLNPAIPRVDDRPVPPVIAYLQREVGRHGRILGLGEELPPNTLMRYDLADIRDYDSIELQRAWEWFEPLYVPGGRERTSRRDINWKGVERAYDRLINSSVQAIVSATPPPAGMFDRVDRVGEVWVARLLGKPLVEGALIDRMEHGLIELSHITGDTVLVREMFDVGWQARSGDVDVAIQKLDDAFMEIKVPNDVQALSLRYNPGEVRIGLFLSIGAWLGLGFGLTSLGIFESIRKKTRGLDGTLLLR